MLRTRAAVHLAPIVAACAIVSPSFAQCGEGWVHGFGGSGVVPPDTVFAVEVLNDGDLIIGGDFDYAGGALCNNIARYNPATEMWSSLGTGVGGVPNARINAIMELPGGDILAGGEFTVAGGVPAQYLALWNGSTWSGFGQVQGQPGVHGGVRALARMPDGTIIAGGNNHGANDIPGGIQQWDGLNWQPLGEGANRIVNALAVLSDGRLLVGGDFSQAGGAPAGRVAIWDGESWSTLGSAIPTSSGTIVYSLCPLPGGGAVIGGNFTTAGGVVASRIATWDGSVWSPMGAGFNSHVLALARAANGQIVAGGSFTLSGATSASFLAHWSGTSWSSLGGGTNSTVRAMTSAPASDIVVAGSFSSAAGEPAPRIARYTFGGPCCGSADFDGDGDIGTDADIEAFFACLAGNCCATCFSGGADFNGDGDVGTDADIEAFFRVLAGGAC